MLSHSARQDVCEPAEYKINTIEKKKMECPLSVCVSGDYARTDASGRTQNGIRLGEGQANIQNECYVSISPLLTCVFSFSLTLAQQIFLSGEEK